jgi:hypothetical protein
MIKIELSDEFVEDIVKHFPELSMTDNYITFTYPDGMGRMNRTINIPYTKVWEYVHD